jgi:hypothetical protein
MKKSIAFIGALFMGSIAFAQVSKNDNTNKTVSRKVLDTDVKDLPPDPEADIQTSEIKGNNSQKMKGEKSDYLKISDNASSKIKGTSGNQKVSGNRAASDPYLKVSSEKKSNAAENTTIKVSGTQVEKSASDPYLKVTSEKKSNTSDNTPVKVSGTQSKETSSDIFLKIGDIKGEKNN